MIKEIALNTNDFNYAVAIIQKIKDSGRLIIRINRKTYGGLITLDGTSEKIELFCSILENKGISTE